MGIIKRPPTLKMAPPGSHVVKKQARISKNGDREYPNLGKVKGYGEFPELDFVIQFWLNFWKEQGLKFPEDLDPFLIKAIIAVESRFIPAVRTKISGSSATGLMQVRNLQNPRLVKKRISLIC
jgi:hypothetical protein